MQIPFYLHEVVTDLFSSLELLYTKLIARFNQSCGSNSFLFGEGTNLSEFFLLH